MLTRREAIVLSLAACLGRSAASRGAPSIQFSDRQYAGAMVIDALGGPGSQDPNVPDDAPLSAKDVADAASSGITAANLTVNVPGNGPNRFEKTIENIAGWDHELAAHPNVFIKILSGKDLLLAKSTHRVGLIFGCQDTTPLHASSMMRASAQGSPRPGRPPTYSP